MILFGYEMLVVPIGLVALYRTLARPVEQDGRRPWQFSLRSLVLLTSLVAVGSAVVKTACENGATVLPIIAVGLAAASTIATVLVLCAALLSRYSDVGQGLP